MTKLVDTFPLKKGSKETIEKNKDRYWLQRWGEDYFQINDEGHVIIRPERLQESINLYELVSSLIKRGINPPILFRFDGIIRDRINCIYSAFRTAIEEYEYKNSYQLAYPVKVNQQRHVVETIRKAANNHILSLEVGSKPELVGLLSIHDTEGALLLCNGYKDEEYIELALLSKKIGRRPIIIIEQFYELKFVLDIAERLNIEAEIGLRIKPHSKGSGKWAASGGELAKFGLTNDEINLAIKELKKSGKENWLKLLHFHIGSQLTSIIPFKKAVREAARVYVEIAKRCPSMSFFDVGGGLAVDYDGTKTTADCSMNYTVEQYARDVVYTIGTICNEENLSHPVILSESGRAIVAHHSILVTEVIDVSPTESPLENINTPPTNEEILHEMYEVYSSITSENALEALHDCADLKENAVDKFIQGDISLEERAYAEKTFRHVSAKVLMLGKKMKYIPEEIEKLDNKLLDIYFCNFSLFQSIPDAWSIQQLFPIMPIHRLDSVPNRKATIVDLTCDSDGTIHNFVHPKKISNWIPLHEFDGTPYFLGIFLVGAYQETLGGLHNLFGDTNAVHVDIDEDGNWEIVEEIEGDTIHQILGYVQYQKDDLMANIRRSIEKGLKSNKLTIEESVQIKRKYKQALESYTYIVV